MKISALFETGSRSILPLPATDDMIARAKAFALVKWRERAAERGLPIPTDLSSSCKFTSQFAQKLFGGKLRGNHAHQWLVVDGKKIDLNDEAADVREMGGYSREQHDRRFFGNREHRESMQSCMPRVEQWVDEFLNSLRLNESYERAPLLIAPRKTELMAQIRACGVVRGSIMDLYGNGEVLITGDGFTWTHEDIARKIDPQAYDEGAWMPFIFGYPALKVLEEHDWMQGNFYTTREGVGILSQSGLHPEVKKLFPSATDHGDYEGIDPYDDRWKPLFESIFHKPADFAYKTDNPGMEACLQKQKTVERLSKEEGGPSSEGLTAKMCTGWPTAHMGIFKPMFFPVKNLIGVNGVNNEHFYRKPGEVKYDHLAKSVREKGWLETHPVMIRVNHRGMAYIVEGNTRIRVAAANGVKYIRVQFEWMNGAEVEDGPWSPQTVAEIAMVDPLNEGAEAWKFYGIEDDAFRPRLMTEPRVLYRSVSLPELEDIFYIGKITGGQNRFNDFEHRRWVFFADEMTDQLIAQGEEVEREAVHSLTGHDLHREYKRLTDEIEEQGMMVLKNLQRLHVPYDEDYEDAFMRGDQVDQMNWSVNRCFSLKSADREMLRNAINELFAMHRKRHDVQDRYREQLKGRHRELAAQRKDQFATSAVIVTKPISGGLVYSKEWGTSGFQTPEYGFHPGQVTTDDIENVIFIKDGHRVGTVAPDKVLAVVRKVLGIQ